MRIIQDKKPKYFLAENVKGLLSLGKGKIFSMILQDFFNAGYNVTYKVLNSADYGVPQKRERVIIVGIRKDLPFLFEFPPKTHSQNGDSHTQKWLSVSEALSIFPDPDTPNDVPNHTYSKF